MSRAVDVAGRGVRVSGRSVGAGIATSDDEDYEHNDLTGVYTGDTGAFSIQTSTVNSGTYALDGDGSGSFNLITRTTQNKWSRDGIKVTFDFQRGDGGGIAFNANQSGYSSMDGYYLYQDGGSNTILRRVDNGSSTDLFSDGGPQSGWITQSIEFTATDITINYYSGSTQKTQTVTDSNYTDLYLGALAFQEVYLDNIRFSSP